jgi:hypothetical protein
MDKIYLNKFKRTDIPFHIYNKMDSFYIYNSKNNNYIEISSNSGNSNVIKGLIVKMTLFQDIYYIPININNSSKWDIFNLSNGYKETFNIETDIETNHKNITDFVNIIKGKDDIKSLYTEYEDLNGNIYQLNIDSIRYMKDILIDSDKYCMDNIYITESHYMGPNNIKLGIGDIIFTYNSNLNNDNKIIALIVSNNNRDHLIPIQISPNDQLIPRNRRHLNKFIFVPLIISGYLLYKFITKNDFR